MLVNKVFSPFVISRFFRYFYTTMHKQKTLISSILVFAITTFSFGITPPTLAMQDPGFIISDQDLFNVNTMTEEDIQQFLDDHEGTLKSYSTLDIDGLVKTSAMIIHGAANRHGVNPQVLLVKLQKEMGLITDSTPKQTQYDWAMGYGVCDSCSTDHPNVIRFKGFANQVDNAAEFLAYVTNSQERFHYQNGGTYEISGETVVIKNNVTAALYNYTPHIHGNEIFLKIWDSWFGSVNSYPDGTLLQAIGEPGVWLIENETRHAFLNLASLTSRYSTNQIIQVPVAVLDQYPVGPAIGFPESSLLLVPDGKIYLLINDELRWIQDEETFRQLGFFPDEVEAVSEEELTYFPKGSPITTASLEPFGALVQDPDTSGVFWVKDGVKSPLVAPELLSLNFPNKITRIGTREELDRYATGNAVLLKDGLLVKSAESPSVYVISNGRKHEIDSEETFNSLGYKWTNIETVTARLLSLHPNGEVLSVLTNLSDKEASQLVEIE